MQKNTQNEQTDEKHSTQQGSVQQALEAQGNVIVMEVSQIMPGGKGVPKNRVQISQPVSQSKYKQYTSIQDHLTYTLHHLQPVQNLPRCKNHRCLGEVASTDFWKCNGRERSFRGSSST